MRSDEVPRPRPTVGQVAWLFLRLGCTAFGGPAAHVAMMEDEVVERRRWLSREEFLDLVAATNLIPGPNSTELAIHVGRLAGWAGFLAAGVWFILPAALLTAALAWAYVEFSTLPAAEHVLAGVKPVVLAVVAQALWRLARTSVKTPFLAVVAVAAVAATVLGVDELLVLLVAGPACAAWHPLRRRPTPPALIAAPLGALPALAVGATVPVTPGGIFLVFLKIGSVLFGSGYVLLAFLRSDLVEARGWLTERQLLDAVAVGQVTPGPVFTTATFVGYLLAGPEGAALATVGIFLPAFVFVALSGPLVPRLRRSPAAGAFLDGVVTASLALMTVVSVRLAEGALVDAVSVGLFVVALILLVRYRVNSAWLVLAGAALGWLLP